MGEHSKEQRSASSCPKVETVVDAVAEAEEDVEGSETCSVITAMSSVICPEIAEAGEHLGEEEVEDEEADLDLALPHDAEDRTPAREVDRLPGAANLLEAALHPENDLCLPSAVHLHGEASLQHGVASLPGAAFPHTEAVFPPPSKKLRYTERRLNLPTAQYLSKKLIYN